LVELDDLGEAESQDIFAAIVECFLELSVNGKASENDLYKLEVFQQYSFFLPRPGGVKGFWQSLFLSTVG
jgi:hypothetical protein